MRKEKQVNIRLECIAAMAHLVSEARHEVLDYLTDGTVADVPQEGAAPKPKRPYPATCRHCPRRP